MAVYKTYKEAVVANGSTEEVFTLHSEWTGLKIGLIVLPLKIFSLNRVLVMVCG